MSLTSKDKLELCLALLNATQKSIDVLVETINEILGEL